MRRRLRRVRVHAIVEELERPAVPPIAVVEEEPPVALGRIDGLQDHDVGAEGDAALPIDRRVVQIADSRLGRSAGVDGILGPAPKPLVGTALAEGMALGERNPLGDPKFYLVAHVPTSVAGLGSHTSLGRAALSARLMPVRKIQADPFQTSEELVEFFLHRPRAGAASGSMPHCS